MHPVRKRFFRKKKLPHYMECLRNYSNFHFSEENLTDIDTTKSMLEKIHQLFDKTCEIRTCLPSFSPEEIRKIVSSYFNPDEELLISLGSVEFCGFLRIPNISYINFNFDKELDPNGVLCITNILFTKTIHIVYDLDEVDSWIVDVEAFVSPDVL